MRLLGEALGAVKRATARVGADWYVFGAQAVMVRGAARATQDLDVTVRVARSERARLVVALVEEGLRHRYPDIADELLVSGAVLPMVHEAGLEVDVVLAGEGLEDLVLSRATMETVDGVAVPVAQATDLVVMKVLAGRGKDLDDVRALLAGDDVDVDEVRSVLQQLEAALGQSDLVVVLDRALDDVGRG